MHIAIKSEQKDVVLCGFAFCFALDDICLVANFSWHGYDPVSIFCFCAIRSITSND